LRKASQVLFLLLPHLPVVRLAGMMGTAWLQQWQEQKVDLGTRADLFLLEGVEVVKAFSTP
jgi:hypothetical protein